MNRRITEILISFSHFLLIAAYYATGWMVTAAPQRTAGIAILATAILLSCGLLLYLLHRRILSGAGVPAAIFFLVLAAAPSGALWFTPFHVAVLLMALCLYCHLCFHAERPSPEYLSIQWIALGSAALFTPPLLWLAPVLALFSVGHAEDKGKFWVTTLLTLLLPFVVFIGIKYVKGDSAPAAACLTDLWSGMTTLHLPSFNLPAITLCRILLTAVVTLLAIVRIASRLTTYKTAHYHVFVRLIVLTISFSALAVLFLSDPSTPAGMLVALPVAPLLGECYIHRRKTACRLLVAILALILAAERIAFFVV